MDKQNPFVALASSRKALLAALGIVAIVFMVTVSRRPWIEIAVPIGSITALLTVLINAIAREDVAKATPPPQPTRNIVASHLNISEAPPPPSPPKGTP